MSYKEKAKSISQKERETLVELISTPANGIAMAFLMAAIAFILVSLFV